MKAMMLTVLALLIVSPAQADDFAPYAVPLGDVR